MALSRAWLIRLILLIPLIRYAEGNRRGPVAFLSGAGCITEFLPCQRPPSGLNFNRQPVIGAAPRCSIRRCPHRLPPVNAWPLCQLDFVGHVLASLS